MKHKFKHASDPNSPDQEHIKREIERTNAKLRHFRGIAAGVLKDACQVWQQIWDVCQDPRTCDEILEGIQEPLSQIPTCGWAEFREKLYLLRHYLDYTHRLCSGSIEDTSKDESEV
jgi:hypothetical protein